MIKRLLVLFTLILWTFVSYAQLSNDFSLQTGEHQASFGQFVKIADRLNYHYKDWTFSGAAGFVSSAGRPNNLDALRGDVSKKIKIKEIPFDGTVFYQWRPFSKRLHELNAGLLFHYQTQTKRWDFYLGAHSRIFRIPNRYAQKYENYNQNIWQIFNVIYRVTFHQQLSKQFQLNASVTNYDLFTLQQETNPFAMVGLAYKASEESKIYLDLAYLQAGFFNIRVNHYGYFIKLGYQLTPHWGTMKKK